MAASGHGLLHEHHADGPYASPIRGHRGPNSILFGVGAPGGLINDRSKVAATARDSGVPTAWARSTGTGSSWMRKVLRKDRLPSRWRADQENGGWRAFDFQEKERLSPRSVRPHRS